MLLIIETLFRALENKKIEREKKLREQFMQKYTCQILMRFEFFLEKYIYIYICREHTSGSGIKKCAIEPRRGKSLCEFRA